MGIFSMFVIKRVHYQPDQK
ncbi:MULTISPECIES: erythromycin resistance leader peptide [Bacillaceae]|nr:erythromycin resistance leader peptide [Caldifermentibacillus hisashii]